MCGIAGYFAPEGEVVARETIEPMLTAMNHRGPDGYGVYYSSACVLGHARLSIIDLKGGWQPIFNENDNLVITFNGEIYNYLELRKELESKGHRFYTRSDTEVIVHAYEEWGKKCPEKFNGQFACAIFDANRNTLFLCRDRFGVRPLYYAWVGRRFVFASEVKALLASRLISASMSPDGLDEIFSLWTNVFPSTPFEGIRELPPAHTMLVGQKECVTRRYWEIPISGLCEDQGEDYEQGTLERLNRSIQLRLRSDVPVGAYLSGGLDSALTTALVRKLTNANLKTFSLEFTDPRFDESVHQKEIVRFLGTEHSSIRCRPEDIVNNLESTVWATERPFLRTAPVPMFLLSRLVRSEGYKVVITGEGADEFFLGYDIFKEAKVRAFCGRLPDSKSRSKLLRRLYPYLFSDARTAKFQEAFFLRHVRETEDPFYGHRLRWDACRRIRDFYSPTLEESISRDPETSLESSLPSDFRSHGPFLRTQLTEVETMLSGYLLSSQGDRVGMAHSVEGRYVFLDHEVIEYACRIPVNVRMPGLGEKAVLKKIGEKLLPPSILRRKKFPYRAPDIDSFLVLSSGRRLLKDTLSPEALRSQGIFDGEKIGAILRGALERGRVTTTENLVLMAALTGQLFMRRFFASEVNNTRFVPADNVRRAVRGEGKCLKSI